MAEFFRTILNFIGSLVLLAIAFLALVFFAGVSEDRYGCEGEFTTESEVRKSEVFLKVQKYRPWILWAESEGAAWSEILNGDFEYYSNLVEIGDFIHMTTSDSRGSAALSTLSGSLSLRNHHGSFLGKCQILRDAG